MLNFKRPTLLTIFLSFLFIQTILSAGQKNVEVWQTFPWLKEDPQGNSEERAMMPEGQALAQMADEEYESVCLSVVNKSENFIGYRVDITKLLQAVPGLKVDILSSWVTPIKDGSVNTVPLKDLGAGGRFMPKDVGDPLLPVDSKRLMYCPVGENRSVWLVLHTKGVKPGIYKAPVSLIEAGGKKNILAKLNITVQVWPFKLPEQLDIICYHWDYGCSEAALKNMKEHKVNTFMINAMPKNIKKDQNGKVTAGLGLDRIKTKLKVIPYAKFIGSYGMFYDYINWSRKKKIEYMSPEFKDTFTKLLKYMIAEYKKVGLDYDDYWLQHIDEPHGIKTKQVIEMGKIAKKIDPKVRWFLTQMSSFKEIQDMAPYSQLMGKRGEAYWSKDEEKWYQEYRKKTGNKIIQFKQLGMYRGTPEVHYYNRLRPWRTWLNKWDGMSTFVYTAGVYKYYTNPVTIRHWEAIREGNEDYQYFAMYRDLAEKQGKTAKQKAIKRIDNFVESLIGPTAPGTRMLYCPETPVVMLYPYQVRAQIAKDIVSLINKNNNSNIKIDDSIRYNPPWLNKVAEHKNPKKLQVSKKVFTLLPIDKNLFRKNILFTVRARDKNNKNIEEKYFLKYKQDDYNIYISGILKPGDKCWFRFRYHWPKSKEITPSIQIDGIKTYKLPRKTAGRWHRFDEQFTVPDNHSGDLNITFKEIRLMRGNKVANQVAIKVIYFDRSTPGGPLPPGMQFVAEAKAEKKSAKTKTADKYREVFFKGGLRYNISFRYKSDMIIHRGIRIFQKQYMNGPWRRISDHGSFVVFLDSLPNTEGKWKTYSKDFMVENDWPCLVGIGSQDYMVREDDKLQRHAPEFQYKDLNISYIDKSPILEQAQKLEKHLAQLKRQSYLFEKNKNAMNIFNHLSGMWKKESKYISEVDFDSTRKSSWLYKHTKGKNAALNRIGFATWTADPGKLPLPDRPRNSSIFFATGTKLLKRQLPKLSGKTAIAIANFGSDPLCFMVKGNNVKAKICLDNGTANQSPKTIVPKSFLDRFGWFEFVVPPGETRYLLLEEHKEISSKKNRRKQRNGNILDLLPMSKYVPGVSFEFNK